MNASQIIERLLKVLYKKHMKDNILRQYGIYPDRLTKSSDIQFANSGDALAAVNRMFMRGWIKIVNFPRAKQVKLYHTIQLTEKGIQRAEELTESKSNLKGFIKEAYIATVEGFTRGFKK